MKVWMRGRFAWRTASQQRSMSAMLARASPQITAFCAMPAIWLTASKSPSEAIGKPASMMSTPISSRSVAICSFSSSVMVAPGDCSPSRSVVSKIRTRSWACGSVMEVVLGLGGFLRRVGLPLSARAGPRHAQRRLSSSSPAGRPKPAVAEPVCRAPVRP